ncbi:MAG: hypothetical protein SNJ57_19675 [Cyanobacteriota bacterium]
MLMTIPDRATPIPAHPVSGAAADKGVLTKLSITIQAGVVIASCIGAIANEIQNLFAPGVDAATVDTLRGGASAKTVSVTDRQHRNGYDPRPYAAALAETYPGYPDRARPVLKDALIRGSTPLLLAALLAQLDNLPALLKGLSPGAIARLTYLLELAIADPEFSHLWRNQ